MHFETIDPDKSISLLVKSIMTFEEDQDDLKTVLPFFADGYPGLMFQETDNGLWVNPHNKKMPPLFLYGQTIKPIELHMHGSYRLIVFQLYPFVLKSFFNVKAMDINDNCYDLQQSENISHIIQPLLKNAGFENRIKIISKVLLDIFNNKKAELDFMVRDAIQFILDRNTQVSITELCKRLHVTERTFERRFLKETGIPAKQFIQILRFQQSLGQLSVKDFRKLTDVVYANGYADQSHFIRVFKAFTGKTPKKFMQQTD